MTALQSTNGNTLEKEVLLQSIEREGIPRSDYRVLQAFNGCPDVSNLILYFGCCHLCEIQHKLWK